MVVRRVRDGPGRDARRQEHRAHPATARAVDSRLRASRPGDLAAARTRVRCRRLVERDDQQTALLERRRPGDPGDPGPQERVGLGQSTGLAVRARRVMSVVAEVGRDEGVVGGRRRRRQVLWQLVEIDDVVVAQRGVVDDRVEVDERVVAGGVLVLRGGRLGAVLAVERGMTAHRRLPRRGRSHVLVVVPPGEAGARQLRGDGRHGRRIHAPGSHRLAVGTDRPRLEVVVGLAVGLVLDVGRLPADHRDVVVVALVPDAVVVGQIGALGGEGLGEVRSRRCGAERGRGRLVLQDDHEHVADRRNRGRRGGRAGGHRRGDEDQAAERRQQRQATAHSFTPLPQAARARVRSRASVRLSAAIVRCSRVRVARCLVWRSRLCARPSALAALP